MPCDNQGEPLPGFWFGRRGRPDPGTPIDDLWMAIGSAPDGSWMFDTCFIGRVAMHGGASTAAAFARWILSAPSEGRYENEFRLIDGEQQIGAGPLADGTWLTVEVLMGREEHGGPEYLRLLLSGETSVQRIPFEVCAPLHCEPVPRTELQCAAARLLAFCATG
ncbi:hypothetical protein ACIBCO_32855 [Streptomyces violascens]|uniref:hypothetical protein n=1 Tax=Streptomyces violascens TaxID=67381 RepID=UPI0037BB14A0